jgi:hypothetical protein
MKTLFSILAICILGSASASAQAMLNGPMTNFQPQMLSIQDHPEHAAQVGMAPEQDLLEHQTILYERGERPLWEVMQGVHATPLGDVARALREQHAGAPKAVVVWKN